ncbi:hypothetical protein CYY_008657 [Polysphondylium violaceum]|uniref:Uncharacterized protein n=1 Tax=Polysphondylium violaceum TaxID=133409 RepID=A0A8J4PNZ8_9MYCE|nr:hypothetical protein CYY_008657 [Polysphondylium violaceum]
MIHLNILIIGLPRTGKTTLSNGLYEHPLNRKDAILSELKKNFTNVEMKYILNVDSTSNIEEHQILSEREEVKRQFDLSKYDFIVCLIDKTNLLSWHFIRDYLLKQNEIDITLFTLNRICLVVTKDDTPTQTSSVSMAEINSFSKYLSIRLHCSNLVDPSSLYNLTDKIMTQIQLSRSKSVYYVNSYPTITPNLLLLDTTDLPLPKSTKIKQQENK